MLTNAKPPSKFDFQTHTKISEKYGIKAAGLTFVPQAWRLDFVGLSCEVHNNWKEGRELSSNSEVKKLKSWLEKRNYDQIILRSSGTAETLQDRGKFASIVLPARWKFKDVLDQLDALFQQASQVDEDASLGVVVQEFLTVRYAGHLSNEYRVSPTINQWSYELERPNWAPSKGINSKLATPPDPSSGLRCGNQIPHQPLRSVAHFLADEFPERCHIEWFAYENSLFIAQIDFEWPEIDQGLDPKRDLKPTQPPTLNLEAATTLKPYKIGTETKWLKLQNLSDFDFQDGNPAPRIYPLSPSRIVTAKQSKGKYEKLKSEMVALTGDRLVVRTECIQKGVDKFNLPRTDTMSVNEALNWCSEIIADFEKRDISKRNFIFLFHAFLPAKSAAWAYAKPGNPVVIVDALWGLPDGLQVLPVDTYEVNVKQSKIVQTNSTYKPKFLTELPDGSWDYRGVKSHCGRHQVLSKADKLEVAIRTANIAEKLGEDAQIMWFCEIPNAYQVGRNVPWFRSRERFDPAPRQEINYRPFSISTPSDLDRLPDEKVTLKLSPHANLIRDEEFLDAIVKVAKERSLPVQVEGSILGHAFYKLDQEGIPVVLSNAPKYYRKRNRQVFGKLVRDKIPANIAAGGETVIEAKLATADLALGLAGKLLEEVEEFLRAPNQSEKAAEIADLLEVVKGIASASGLSWKQIDKMAREKSTKRGGFKDGRVLVETTLPHRDSPIERQEQVRLGDLGAVETTENTVEIPASSLVATANGPGVIFSFEDDTARFRVSLRGGRVQFVRLDSKVPESPNDQRELF
jgi:predicted house-cleaning noncanonical NTP pyrophosphatase (MazG superfamily)